jgi:hypothetical protein
VAAETISACAPLLLHKDDQYEFVEEFNDSDEEEQALNEAQKDKRKIQQQVTLRCPQARQLVGWPMMSLIAQLSANVMPERHGLKGFRLDRCKPSPCACTDLPCSQV